MPGPSFQIPACPRLPSGLLLPLLACALPLSGDTFTTSIRPLLEANCYACHDASDSPEAGLALETIQTEAEALASRDLWLRVYQQVESGMMPPPKRRAQPTPAQRADLLAYLQSLLALPDPDLDAPDPGKPVLRRLNRLEYNNTVRDLLGLDYDLFAFPERLPLVKDYFQPGLPAMPARLRVRALEAGSRRPYFLPQAGLPNDNRAEHGYNNQGSALNLSPLLLEKYVEIAHALVESPALLELPFYRQWIVADTARLPAPTPYQVPPAALAGTTRADWPSSLPPRYRHQENPLSLDSLRERLPNAHPKTRGGFLAWPAPAESSLGVGQPLVFPLGPAGEKAILLQSPNPLLLTSGGGLSPFLPPPPGGAGDSLLPLEISLLGGVPGEQLEYLGCVVHRPDLAGEISATVSFSDGTHATLIQPTETSPAEAARNPHLRRPPPLYTNTEFVFRAPPAASITGLTIAARPGPLSLASLAVLTAPPSLREAEVSLAGPDRDHWKSLARQRLPALLTRVFRRPPDPAEVDRYLSLFDQVAARGGTFEEAFRLLLRTALSSSQFLFRVESTRPDLPPVRPLDAWEVASRLSYFLWASGPDPELLALAADGRLLQPAILRTQVERMLTDPRARELSESFAFQWLRLDQLFAAKPDRELFPHFYSGPQGKITLHLPMLTEAILFFESILLENRPLLDFIAADFSYLNAPLAKLYGVPLPLPSPSPADGKPPLPDPDDWFRASFPDRSRGGIMFMGGPLLVTSLPTRTSPIKRGAWLLETVFNRPPLEPKVAFVLKETETAASRPMTVRERFEAHRSQPSCYSCHSRIDPPGFALEAFDPVGSLRSLDAGLPVDASGDWHGHTFNGPAEFRAAVLQNPREFTRGLVEHLLTYALGRKIAYHDMPVVDGILTRTAADHHRLRDVIAEIVLSYPFLHVRNRLPPEPPLPAPTDAPVLPLAFRP